MNGRDVQRRVSVRSRATHAALVYRLLRLRNLPSHPFRLGAGPAPTLRGTFASGNAHPHLARGVDLVRAARPLLGTLKIDQLKLRRGDVQAVQRYATLDIGSDQVLRAEMGYGT
ncbi:hypothetical protein BJY52DRAFT_1224004 [Lactarius psammicola]|nr:hypothetical protein BJY52DRAFT_1224004 [Lactarius psammicola]